MRRNVIISFALLLVAGAVGSRVSAFPAAPTLSDVTFRETTLGGHRYYDVKATLNGTGVAGNIPYRVPATFLYPVDPDDCNGTGIVDLLNNSAMLLLASEGLAEPPLASARERLTGKFLGRRGYFYVSVQWEKTRGATDVIGTFNNLFGTNYAIPTASDQFAIILDAALLVKAPPAGLPGSPCAVSKAAVYGMAASTVPIIALKQPALSGPVFSRAFADLYDGAILDSITSGFLPVPISMDGVLTIVISAETDVQLFRNDLYLRGENAQYRSYEVAGVTHVSRDQHDLDDIVAMMPQPPSRTPRQNLATHSPVFRAMTEHMRAWMNEGTPPPPSTTLEGSNYGTLPLGCQGLPIPGIADIPRDSAGNARGGIRLPHVDTPIGSYDGVEMQYGCSAGGFPELAIVTGTFIRDDATLHRYRDHLSYVLGVARSAGHAVKEGWILPDDWDDYVRTALRCVVGRKAPHRITLDDLKDCH